MRIWIAIGCALSLSLGAAAPCAAAPAEPPAAEAAPPAADEGWVVYSIVSQVSTTLNVLRVDADGKARWTPRVRLMKGEFMEKPPAPSARMTALTRKPAKGDLSGEVYVRSLPAGRYRVDSLDIVSGVPGLVWRDIQIKPTDFEFEVRPGSATYLGSLQVRQYMTKGLLPQFAEVTAERLDKRERDMPYALKREPLLAQAPPVELAFTEMREP